MGAGAEELAHAVATNLGFRYVDEEIVAQAAAREGVDPGLVADAEARRSLLHRILRQLAHNTGPFGMPAPEMTRELMREESIREVIRDVITETAAEGNVVIVAHGASLALGGRDDVLRVLVTASRETRARRLAEDGTTRDEAMRTVKDSDAARADYLKKFYDVDREQPTLYDVVLNVDRMTPERGAELVVAAAA
jgi:cytidylate kinase